MRTHVDADLATRAHQVALDAMLAKHEAPFAAAIEHSLRAMVREAVRRFREMQSLNLVAAPARADEPERVAAAKAEKRAEQEAAAQQAKADAAAKGEADNEIRDKLASAGIKVPLTPQDLADLKREEDRLKKLQQTYTGRIRFDTIQQLATDLTTDVDLSNRLLKGVIENQAGAHIITAPLQLIDKMMAKLQQSYDKGESIPKAATEMRKVGYTEAKGFAARIARTETIGASNGASLALVSVGTDLKYKVWMATEDSRTRETHSDADGQTVTVLDTFTVGMDQLEYPGDPSGSPDEIINCRCTIGYTDTPDVNTIAGGREQMSAVETTETDDAAAVGAAWSGVVAQEGVDTGDGRTIAEGALSWRELPLTLMAQHTTPDFGGHAEAQVAGRIDTLARQGKNIQGTGIFDTGEWGAETERMVREEMLNGISIDLAVEQSEIIPAEGVEDEIEAWFLGTLNITKGTVLGATIVPFPAFENASIAIVAGAAMHLRNARRDDDGKLIVSFYMPFTKACIAPPDEGREALADLAAVVAAYPSLIGKVTADLGNGVQTFSFPGEADPEPQDDAQILAALDRARSALATRMAAKS